MQKRLSWDDLRRGTWSIAVNLEINRNAPCRGMMKSGCTSMLLWMYIFKQELINKSVFFSSKAEWREERTTVPNGPVHPHHPLHSTRSYRSSFRAKCDLRKLFWFPRVKKWSVTIVLLLLSLPNVYCTLFTSWSAPFQCIIINIASLLTCYEILLSRLWYQSIRRWLFTPSSEVGLAWADFLDFVPANLWATWQPNAPDLLQSMPRHRNICAGLSCWH